MRFVLINGACHGAWCWDLVVPELTARGHETVAVELPGSGTRVGETASLRGYRDAVVEHLAGGDVVVGHSMGCAVAAIAADARPDLVGHVCFLSGPLPVEGRSLSYQSTSPSVGGAEAADESESYADRNMKVAADGSAFSFDRRGAQETFFHDCDEQVVDWAVAHLTPQQMAPVIEPISIRRFWEADLPRSYIRCLRDRAWHRRIGDLQAARLGVVPLDIDSSHSPFLSRPAELAALLVRAAGTTPAGPLAPGESVPAPARPAAR
jgi:pimeloyl-ACP methyl ester carboxylesterase